MTEGDDPLIAAGEGARTREDFVRFLGLLHDDFAKRGGTWENPTLSTFLDAMAVWAADCPGYYRNMRLPVDPNKPQWRVFADILLAARVYE